MSDLKKDISSELLETVIGINTKFKGNVKTDKPIRIDGYYEGTIDSTTYVVISETGEFHGTLRCETLRLFGKGYGNAFCTGLCDIAPAGYFEGDVITVDLLTVKGSIINGKVIINK